MLTYPFNESSWHFPLFEVCLSIQVLCVDVAEAVFVRRPQDQDVGGDHLVAGQVNQIADPDIGPQTFAVSAQRAEKTNIIKLVH